MTGISLATAQAQLDTWIQAETKVAAGQAYQIGQRSLKRADLQYIAERIRYWNQMVISLTRNGGRQGIGVSFAVPTDC